MVNNKKLPEITKQENQEIRDFQLKQNALKAQLAVIDSDFSIFLSELFKKHGFLSGEVGIDSNKGVFVKIEK